MIFFGPFCSEPFRSISLVLFRTAHVVQGCEFNIPSLAHPRKCKYCKRNWFRTLAYLRGQRPALALTQLLFSISADLQRTRLGSNKYSTPIEAVRTGLLSQQARMKGNVRFYLTFFFANIKGKTKVFALAERPRNKVVFKLIQIQIQIHFSTKESFC